LTTIPDSTSRKFILLGTYPRGTGGHHTIIFLDFANEETGGSKMRQCDKDKDMEKWYARPQNGKECLMGHKVRIVVLFISCAASAHTPRTLQQWYFRRKPDADCYVGNKFEDPIEHEDNCPCEKEDFEWWAMNSDCAACWLDTLTRPQRL